MINLDSFSLTLDSNFAHLLAKIIFVAFLLLYNILAFLILRQAAVMNRTVETVMSRTIGILAWLHFLVAIVLLVAVVTFF